MKSITQATILLIVVFIYSCKPTQNSSNNNVASSSFFSDEMLGDLYASSMQGCYEYMFDASTSFELNGEQHGTFCAGIKGMVLYSGFDKAVKAYIVAKDGVNADDYNDFYDVTKFQQFAGGIAVFTNVSKVFNPWGFQKDGIQQFHRYNPAFVEWALQNLMPKPSTKVGDVTAKALYQGVFKRYFRMMAETYQYLQRKGYDQEVAAYQQLFPGKSFDGLRYLNERYAGLYEKYGKIKGVSTMTAPMAFGFWLRRKIDGTDKLFWKGLQSLLSQYDAQWYQSKTKKD